MKSRLLSLIETAANTAALLTLILPFLLPVCAFADGGGKPYQELSITLACASMLFSILPASVLLGIASVAEDAQRPV